MIKDIIIIAVIVLIVGGALAYIIKAKKNGKKCIGCPYSGSCGKSCCGADKGEGSCCCGGKSEETEEK